MQSVNNLSPPPPPPDLDHRSLLVNLKKSIELWFQANGDSEYYFHVHNALNAILANGLQFRDSDIDEYTKFVTDLKWLNSCGCGAGGGDTVSAADDLSQWLLDNLKSNSLCASLRMLAADGELLEQYYSPLAFVRNEKYSTALFICLSAFELNQSSLLSQIDESALSAVAATFLTVAKHKRSNSHPNFSITTAVQTKNVEFPRRISAESPAKRLPLLTFRKWKSLPELKEPERMVDVLRRRRKTFSQNIGGSVVFSSSLPSMVDGKEPTATTTTTTASDSSTDGLVSIQLLKCDDIKIWTEQSSTSTARPLTPAVPCQPQAKGISPINSFFSNIFPSSPNKHTGGSWSYNSFGGSSTTFSSPTPHSDGVFKSFLPRYGEKLPTTPNMFDDIAVPEANSKLFETRRRITGRGTLTSFLQASQLSRNNTELEKENAHFKISEAVISAMEQIKCAKMEREIMKLEVAANGVQPRKRPALKKSKMIDIIRSTTTANGGGSSADIESSARSESDDDCEDNQVTHRLPFVRFKTDSIDHITYAELEDSTADVLSAEGIGLSLMLKFSDNQIPKLADLKWLVSEEDAPQELLPMPANSNNPDDNVIQPLTRGTRYWAPPRQQIIFTDHPSHNRKELIIKQNYRCAGCGMRVSPNYISRFRYCTYLGKYHCTGCHRNQIAVIPAKVLASWDFKNYAVSVFSYRLLEQMWTYPLYHLPDLNSTLYNKIKHLLKTRIKRAQLKFVKDFISTCRFAEEEQKYFNNIPDYVTSEPDKWSMSDLNNSRDKTMQQFVDNIIEKCEVHVFQCVLCTARGFICELCSKETIIYPWQKKVIRCDKCGACYHQNCRKPKIECSKCQRLLKRRLQQGDL